MPCRDCVDVLFVWGGAGVGGGLFAVLLLALFMCDISIGK